MDNEMNQDDIEMRRAEHRRGIIASSSVEERISGLSVEEVLAGLTPEEIFEALNPEDKELLVQLVKPYLPARLASCI